MPPPVLVSAATTLDALAETVPAVGARAGRGVLARPAHARLPPAGRRCSGTSARPAARSRCGCPTHEVALAAARAHRPARGQLGQPDRPPAATDADQAEEMLGDSVAVILDAGASPGRRGLHDRRRHRPEGRVLRLGALSLERAQRGDRGARRRARRPGLGRMREYLLVFLVAAVGDLPADRRRPRDRAAHGRRRRGPRPRRARRSRSPYLGGLAMLGGLVAAYLVARQLPFLSTSEAFVFRDAGAVLLGGPLVCARRGGRRHLRARRADQARRPGARRRLPGRAGRAVLLRPAAGGTQFSLDRRPGRRAHRLIVVIAR